MRTGKRSNWWVPAVFPILAVIAGGSIPAEILLHPGGWLFPNIVTSEKEAIRLDDRTPLIPGKETMRKGYRKRDGTFFQTYEIEGRIFGVEVDTNGNTLNLPEHFELQIKFGAHHDCHVCWVHGNKLGVRFLDVWPNKEDR